MTANRNSNSADLASTQQWMMAAITAVDGLPMGLESAQKSCGWRIDEIVKVPVGISAHSRLDIYAQGYWLRLLSCLQSEYPALRRHLGDELFEFFARAYLANHPSSSFSLYDLGSNFARFLRRTQSAAAQAGRRREMRFPLELAQIELAQAAAMRAAGLENEVCELPDPLVLLLGGNVELALADTTTLLLASHPLGAFKPWLAGSMAAEAPESGIGYIAVARRRFHVSFHELTGWQFYSLAAARRRPRSLLYCAQAASRRCRRPVHEILSQLAFWLPAAQAGGLLKMS